MDFPALAARFLLLAARFPVRREHGTLMDTHRKVTGMNKLANEMNWGYRNGFPDDVTDGWGARGILQRGEVDLLNDRQSYFGDAEIVDQFCSRMNANKEKWRKNVKDLYYSGEVDPSKNNHVVIYEDEFIKMVGNTQGSFGHFYMAGWLKK